MTNQHFLYHPATLPELDAIWDKNIADNPGDDRWAEWKQTAIENQRNGDVQTFLVMRGEVPVGEGTLVFSPRVLRGNSRLADGAGTVNVSALRMDQPLRGQGHISKLVKVMEQYARDAGYKTITIGVEARETRNLAIYLHWGYGTFVMSEILDGELVLFYAKDLEVTDHGDDKRGKIPELPFQQRHPP